MSISPDDAGRGTLSEIALKSVMGLIRSGELKPGAIVNEVELAKKLGMSRGPVREAVRTLEGRKIVTREAFQRARVSKLNADQISAIFELREALEGMACRLATRRMSDEDLAKLASSATVLSPGDNSFVTTDSHVNFHQVIVGACGNERIQAVLSDDVYDVVRFYRWSSPPVERIANGRSHEHWQIVRAMQSRDEELAESLMRAHIRRVRQLVVVDIFPVATPEQVFGSLPAKGKAKTIEEMDRGVLAEATRRHKRGSQGGKGA